MKSERDRRKDLLPLILILAGIAVIGLAFWAKIETWFVQQDMLKQYQNSAAQVETKNLELPSDSAVFVAADDSDNSGDITDVSPIDASIETIGILRIPKIDLTVALGEGTDKETLKYSVGHFKETVNPGEIGNFSVIGHRSYTYAEFFNRLDEIEKGDLIMVQSEQKTYTYTVMEKFVVEPEDTWVLDSGDDAEITLITCTPIRIATHRLIVKGILTATE